MKGVKKGKNKPIFKVQLDQHTIQTEQQIANQVGRHYKLGLVDPKTKDIQWVDSVLMNVRPKLPQQKQSKATSQTWDINYKKKLVQQFGTSKSKRKINQMLSNTINS